METPKPSRFAALVGIGACVASVSAAVVPAFADTWTPVQRDGGCVTVEETFVTVEWTGFTRDVATPADTTSCVLVAGPTRGQERAFATSTNVSSPLDAADVAHVDASVTQHAEGTVVAVAPSTTDGGAAEDVSVTEGQEPSSCGVRVAAHGADELLATPCDQSPIIPILPGTHPLGDADGKADPLP